MNPLSRLRLRLSYKVLPHLHSINKLVYDSFSNAPFTRSPLASPAKYYSLANIASLNISTDVTDLETSLGYTIDREWLDQLALFTQIVIKPSNLCYSHGRVLYSLLCDYLSRHDLFLKPITIFETGTARGFSSLCMAKALSDLSVKGLIHTCDILPHSKPMYWNTISDHLSGPISRRHLLQPWDEYLKYIFFVQSSSLSFLYLNQPYRVNFAFLDGSHTFSSVLKEFLLVSEHQLPGDIIVFDDYDSTLFPGVVQALKHISDNYNYDLNFIHCSDTRYLAIATKF